MTETVIGGAAVWVGENRVSLVDLFEALLGMGFFVHVGVVLARQLAECLLEVIRGGVAGYAQDFIIVAFAHMCFYVFALKR
jgi:hypothetical protein